MKYHSVFDKLQRHEQRGVLYSILSNLSSRFSSDSTPLEAQQLWEAKIHVAATAGLIKGVVDSDFLRNELATWLTSSSAGGIGEGIGVRRAVIAVLAEDSGSSPRFRSALNTNRNLRSDTSIA